MAYVGWATVILVSVLLGIWAFNVVNGMLWIRSLQLDDKQKLAFFRAVDMVNRSSGRRLKGRIARVYFEVIADALKSADQHLVRQIAYGDDHLLVLLLEDIHSDGQSILKEIEEYKARHKVGVNQ